MSTVVFDINKTTAANELSTTVCVSEKRMIRYDMQLATHSPAMELHAPYEGTVLVTGCGMIFTDNMKGQTLKQCGEVRVSKAGQISR